MNIPKAFTAYAVGSVLGLIAAFAIVLATGGASPATSAVAAGTVTPIPCSAVGPKLQLASNPLSAPAGSDVTYRVRVRAACPSSENNTITLSPQAGMTLVTTGNTGPWNCAENPDGSMTCNRPGLLAYPLASTLTFIYHRETFNEDRMSACLTVESPAYGVCNAAYSAYLP